MKCREMSNSPSLRSGCARCSSSAVWRGAYGNARVGLAPGAGVITQVTLVMLEAVRDFREQTGQMIGVKPGGYLVLEKPPGTEWTGMAIWAAPELLRSE